MRNYQMLRSKDSEKGNCSKKTLQMAWKCLTQKLQNSVWSQKLKKKDNLGRPVVSSVNCHISSISKYVVYHLQPIVKDMPSYVRDTKDFWQN